MTTATNSFRPAAGGQRAPRWKQFINRAVELLGGPAVTYQRTWENHATARAVAAIASTGTPVRPDLVKSIRRQIAEGVYDTPEKLDQAVLTALNKN